MNKKKMLKEENKKWQYIVTFARWNSAPKKENH